MKIEVTETRMVEVKFLQAECKVRYWEDATVNGIDDENGDLIPCRDGDHWCPLIDIETGKIQNWRQGATAKVHYKVYDEGLYIILDKDKKVVKEIDGYVPDTMCPKEKGYGDYVIMDINENGIIENWNFDADDFSNYEED